MIRVTKKGDPRILRTYRKFTCAACGCEFIADDGDYTVETHYLPPLDELDPLALCDRRSTETFSSTCPDCGTYIKADRSEVECVPYEEIVKLDEKKIQEEDGFAAMILKDLLKSFFLPTSRICVIGWDEMLGDRVIYRGRVDRLLAMEFSDPSFEKALRCGVDHVDNGGAKFIDIYCDKYVEPMTREKIMEAFAKYDGGRFKNDCE